MRFCLAKAGKIFTFVIPKANMSPGGEIGRRTILRGWRSYGRGSSNLLLGTDEKG